MDADRRDSIREALRRLIETHNLTMEILEQANALLSEEFALGPIDRRHEATVNNPPAEGGMQPLIDRSRFMVTFHGQSCFLGNTMAFRFLIRLAERPGQFVSHQKLFEDVWDGRRSADAVRSMVRNLRRKLRLSDLNDLADAIDGSAPGHYALRLADFVVGYHTGVKPVSRPNIDEITA